VSVGVGRIFESVCLFLFVWRSIGLTKRKIRKCSNWYREGIALGLELGRYRYLESVFGIFVGIFSCRFGIGILKYLGIGISEILVEYRKFLVYPTFIWRPCWKWPRRNFTVPFGKLEWWGQHQVMKKFDSKIGRFDTSTWQTDTARHQRPRYGLRREVSMHSVIMLFEYFVFVILYS